MSEDGQDELGPKERSCGHFEPERERERMRERERERERMREGRECE